MRGERSGGSPSLVKADSAGKLVPPLFLPKQKVEWAWFACTWTLVFKRRTVYHRMRVGRHFGVIFNFLPSGSIWVEHKTNMKPKFTFWIHLASKASLYLELWKYSSFATWDVVILNTIPNLLDEVSQQRVLRKATAWKAVGYDQWDFLQMRDTGDISWKQLILKKDKGKGGWEGKRGGWEGKKEQEREGESDDIEIHNKENAKKEEGLEEIETSRGQWGSDPSVKTEKHSSEGIFYTISNWDLIRCGY